MEVEVEAESPLGLEGFRARMEHTGIISLRSSCDSSLKGIKVDDMSKESHDMKWLKRGRTCPVAMAS